MTRRILLTRNGAPPHDPTDYCADTHCWSHHVDEPADNPYLTCGECFHTFPTKRALRRDYRRHVIWQIWIWDKATRRPAATFPGLRRPTLWRTLRRMATLRVSNIHGCPHCSHDL
jgi:hypothetical protein